MATNPLLQKPTIDPYSPRGKKPRKVKGQIAFKNTVFSYPTREDITVSLLYKIQ